jgi:hypothetical protein
MNYGSMKHPNDQFRDVEGCEAFDAHYRYWQREKWEEASL